MQVQTSVVSSTVCNHPIVACLVAMEQILGSNRKWRGVNVRQREFISEVFEAMRNEVSNFPELESISSRDYNEINGFLKSKGFDIQLNPFYPPDFGVASVLKLAMEWLVKGEATTIHKYGHSGMDQFPAVLMKKNGTDFYEAPDFKNPIVAIKTKTEDVVYLTMVDKPLLETDLRPMARVMLATKNPSFENYLGVVFPMIDLDTQPDISWLCGMNTNGDDGAPGIISQAKQQTRFKMDELGATVESAVAMAVMRGLGGPTYHIIDKPFLAVVERPSLKEPVFVGYLTEECWKRPKR